MKKSFLVVLCMMLAMVACLGQVMAETAAPAVEEAPWSENPLEAMIPQPPFEILYASSIEGIFYMSEFEASGFGGKNEVAYEDLLVYADQLRAAGFTEYEVSGIDEASNMYSFCALNPENMCYVTIYFGLGQCYPKHYGWDEDTTSMVQISIFDVANMRRPPFALRQAGYEAAK